MLALVKGLAQLVTMLEKGKETPWLVTVILCAALSPEYSNSALVKLLHSNNGRGEKMSTEAVDGRLIPNFCVIGVKVKKEAG